MSVSAIRTKIELNCMNIHFHLIVCVRRSDNNYSEYIFISTVIVSVCRYERKLIILNVGGVDLVNVGLVNVRGCMIVFLICLLDAVM